MRMTIKELVDKGEVIRFVRYGGRDYRMVDIGYRYHAVWCGAECLGTGTWYVAMGRPPGTLGPARAALRGCLPFGLDISTWNAGAKNGAEVATMMLAAVALNALADELLAELAKEKP